MRCFLSVLGLIAFSVSHTLFAQQLEVGLGLRAENSVSSAIRAGNVVFYSPAETEIAYPLQLGYQHQISNRFEIISGVRYSQAGRGFNVYKDTLCSLCPITKVGVVAYRVLEFPQQVAFNLFNFGKLHLGILASITPVWQFDIESHQYDGPIREPGWSPEVVSVFNHRATVIKPWYFDYSYGLQLRYADFVTRIYLKENLSNSTTKPLVTKNGRYSFNTRSLSLNLSLSYAFRLGSKKEEKIKPLHR